MVLRPLTFPRALLQVGLAQEQPFFTRKSCFFQLTRGGAGRRGRKGQSRPQAQQKRSSFWMKAPQKKQRTTSLMVRKARGEEAKRRTSDRVDSFTPRLSPRRHSFSINSSWNSTWASDQALRRAVQARPIADEDRAWSSIEREAFDGKGYTVLDVECLPVSVQHRVGVATQWEQHGIAQKLGSGWPSPE